MARRKREREGLTGRVVAVEDELAGSFLTSAHGVGVSVLTLDDVEDFSDSGGSAWIDQGDATEEVVAWVEEGVDDAFGTVTLTAATTQAHEADAPVTLKPLAKVRYAAVNLEDDPDNQVWARVPIHLKRELTPGIRDEDEDAEAVTVVWDADRDEYRVTDVLAREEAATGGGGGAGKGDDPNAPANLVLLFDEVEKARFTKYRAIARCDEMADFTGASGIETTVTDYEYKLAKVDPLTLVNPATNKYQQEGPPRSKTKKAKDDDDVFAQQVFMGVKRFGYYQVKARVLGAQGEKGPWSNWTDPAQAAAAPPPDPQTLTAIRALERVGVDWEYPDKADDPDQVDERVVYSQVQVTQDPTWVTVWKRDRQVSGTRRAFRSVDFDTDHYLRVRSVDSDGDKSAWVYLGGAFPGTPVRPKFPKTVATWSRSGKAKVKVGKHRWYAEKDFVIHAVRLSVGLLPDGQAIIVDVHKNGSTVFTDQGTRPKVTPTDPNQRDRSVPQVTTLNDGDYLAVHIDQIGTTEPGRDVVVQVVLRAV